MAQLENQLKKMMSKVSPRRARWTALSPLPSAPAGPGPTQPTRLPGGSEAPVQFPVAWRPPSPEMPVSLRRNPRFGAGASGGQRQSTKARSGGRLPPAVRHLLSGESLEQFVGAM